MGQARHSAASGKWTGRGTSTGQPAPSGQLSENQSIARSKVAVVTSLRPDAIPSSVDPRLRTIVDTRCRPMPFALPNSSETKMICSRKVAMMAENTELIPRRQRKLIRLPERLDADSIPPMNETFNQRLNRLVSASPLAPQAISRQAGLDKETLRKLLSNPQQSASAKSLTGLARVLGVSEQYLLTGVENGSTGRTARMVDSFDPDAPDRISDETMSYGTETGGKNIPEGHSAQIDVTAGMGAGGLTTIVEGVSANNGLTFAADHVRDHWRLPGEVLSGLSLKASNVAIVPVQGDSMLPTLNEGDFVFVDTRHRFPSPDGIYAIADNFGGIVIKRLEVISGRSEEDMMVSVISDNRERHAARTWRLDEMHIIGRVVRRFGVVR